MGLTFAVGNHVEQVVNAVAAVDISHAACRIHGFGAGGSAAAEGMASPVLLTTIGLGFGDPAAGALTGFRVHGEQYFAQQIPGNGQRIRMAKKGDGQDVHNRNMGNGSCSVAGKYPQPSPQLGQNKLTGVNSPYFWSVIQIGKYLVSDDLVQEAFACDLGACHGACCVEGDDGAILSEEDPSLLEAAYDEVKPYLTEEGKAVIETEGFFVVNEENQLRTPLIKGKACAYAIERDGVALCGIELAWLEGKTAYRKPVSCHLYPVRTKALGEFTALNYERWDICAPACDRGKREGLPVYKFLKGALVRYAGEDFYDALDAAATHLRSKGKGKRPSAEGQVDPKH